MGQYLIGYPEKTFPRLTHFGYSDEPREFDSGIHWHLGYEFVFFIRGGAHIQVTPGASPLFFGEDDLLITAPDIPHKFATPPAPLSYAWFGLQAGQKIAGVTDKLMFSPDIKPETLLYEGLHFTEDKDPDIEILSHSLPLEDIQVIRRIAELRQPLEQIRKEILRPKFLSREYIHLKIMELVTLILRRLHANRAGSPGKSRSLYSEVMEYTAEYIRSRLHTTITLDKLAGITGYNPSYLSRCFSGYFGVSPMGYVKRCRVEHAKICLCGGMGVTETAEACGFGNVHYFCTVFKQETGTTPGSYGPSR